MKESFSQDPFMLTVQNSFQEHKSRKIFKNIRRGYPPLAHDPKLDYFDHKISECLEKTEEGPKQTLIRQTSKVGYPWTCLGSVQYEYKDEKLKISTGVIIGSKYVMTARCDRLYMNGELYFIPFSSKEKIKVEKVYPYSLDRRAQEDSISILQFSRKANLEENYGSLGYEFANREVSQKRLLLADIVNQEEENAIFVVNGNMRVKQRHIEYDFPLESPFSKGSPILYYKDGEFFVCGMHCSENGDRGISLTKQISDRFDKFTFQGYLADFSHKVIRQKEVRVLQQLQFKKVMMMDLADTSFPSSGVRLISRANLNLLQDIILSNNRLTDDDLQYLSRATWKNLHSFSAQNNRFTHIGIKSLSRAQWKNLSVLELNNNPIGSKGFRHFGKNDWKLLKTLLLDQTQLDNEGCEKIRKCQFPHLKQLSLKKNRIQNDGLKWLLKAEWKQLKFLALCKNQLREEGIKSIVEGNWSKLHILHFGIHQAMARIKQHEISIRDKASFQIEVQRYRLFVIESARIQGIQNLNQ